MKTLDDKLKEILLAVLCTEISVTDARRKLKALFEAECLEIIGKLIWEDKSHICEYNDGEQNCTCYIEGYNSRIEDQRAALKEKLRKIKEV